MREAIVIAGWVICCVMEGAFLEGVLDVEAGDANGRADCQQPEQRQCFHPHYITKSFILYSLIMHLYKSQSIQPSHIDNFSIRSKASDSIMVEPKEQRIRRREKTEETGRQKQFLINGVDFHAGEIVVHRQGEVLEDIFSVKGDYFYLKRGEIVNVRFAIGEYVEIKFQQKIGYFPASLIRLIEGQRWRTK